MTAYLLFYPRTIINNQNTSAQLVLGLNNDQKWYNASSEIDIKNDTWENLRITRYLNINHTQTTNHQTITQKYYSIIGITTNGRWYRINNIHHIFTYRVSWFLFIYLLYFKYIIRVLWENNLIQNIKVIEQLIIISPLCRKHQKFYFSNGGLCNTP